MLDYLNFGPLWEKIILGLRTGLMETVPPKTLDLQGFLSVKLNEVRLEGRPSRSPVQ